MPTGTRLLAVLVGILLVSGCSGASDDVSDPSLDAATDEPAEIPWTDEEQSVLFGCASEKLGYTLTAELYNAPVEDDDGITNTEPEWEAQRQVRAYLQCMFEQYPDKVAEDPAAEILYHFAFAIGPDGNQLVDDPLAPWPGKDNLP
ncbi:MAG: hypothetical protein FWE61_04995 [Micrococcales bacterium]|nr:hypothetical protein [Micrococcales bacterium]